jgi:hypothetical protein
MNFQLIFGWKSLPEAGFGKNVAIDADRCSGSRLHLDHPNAGRSVVQDHSSDHRFKRLHLTRASVRRSSGFVLTDYPELIHNREPVWETSLDVYEARRLHQLKPRPWARKLAPTFVYSVDFARIAAIRAAVVETSMP